MLNFLIHCYLQAEVYAFILSWIVVPLFYYATYLFLRNHYGMFIPPEKTKEGGYGTDR